MDVQLDRDSFLKGLQMVQNIVEPRQALPILANVLIQAEGESVRLTATDLEVGATVSVPAKIGAPGAVTLSARKLTEIARELPAAALSLKAQDNAWVALRCGGAAFKLAGLPAGDFPAVTPAATAGWVTIEAKVLKEMIEQTSFAVSHDEGRYALNGILFAVQGKEIRLVATDGHRLAVSTRALREAAPTATGIVPRKGVLEIGRVLGVGEEVQIALAENQFVLRMPNFVMLARLIEGQFPNWEQVLPKAQPRRVTLSRAGFTAALRRVSVMAEERTRPIKLIFMPGTLRLLAYHPELGEAEEALEVGYSGEELTIGFNSRYLLEALAPLAADEVLMELNDAMSPGVIKSFQDEGTLCVIMPMRI
jgi:DNA polymerase III subunit beta